MAYASNTVLSERGLAGTESAVKIATPPPLPFVVVVDVVGVTLVATMGFLSLLDIKLYPDNLTLF